MAMLEAEKAADKQADEAISDDDEAKVRIPDRPATFVAAASGKRDDSRGAEDVQEECEEHRQARLQIARIVLGRIARQRNHFQKVDAGEGMGTADASTKLQTDERSSPMCPRQQASMQLLALATLLFAMVTWRLAVHRAGAISAVTVKGDFQDYDRRHRAPANPPFTASSSLPSPSFPPNIQPSLPPAWPPHAPSPLAPPRRVPPPRVPPPRIPPPLAPPPHCPGLESRVNLATLAEFAPVRCYMLDSSHPAVAARYLRCNGTACEASCTAFYSSAASHSRAVRLCYLDGSSRCRATHPVHCSNAPHVSAGWPAPPPSTPPVSPPLPPAWPSPPSRPASVVAALNDRYFHGRPSNDLDEAGVLVHLDDGMTASAAPWEPCMTGWCAAIGSDHESCTLINRELPHLYSSSYHAFGLVLSGRILQQYRPGGVLCTYAQDGGTWAPDAACRGEPPLNDSRCASDSPPSLCFCTLQRWWDCVFPPHSLEDMLQTQIGQNPGGYNEVVINSTFWRSQLPAIIEAFVDFGGGEVEARRAFKGFHRRYQGQLGGREVPLLRWTSDDGFQYLSAPPPAPTRPPPRGPLPPPPLQPPPSWPPLPPFAPMQRKCRAHCPPDVEPLAILAAYASQDASPAKATNELHSSSMCVDGSRVSWCMPGPPGEAWLSVHLPPGRTVHSVELHVFYPWGDASYQLSPYEVWAGDRVGARTIRCNATLATARGLPTADGVPAIVPCLGVHTDTMPFITVRQAEESDGSSKKYMRLNEIVVYAPSPPRGMLLSSQPGGPNGSMMAATISRRFEDGVPSNDAAAAGVLVHVFDDYEQSEHPWELCSSHECQHRSDHWSASVINARKPALFGSWGGGFIIDPTVPILCAYPRDYGIGNYINAACDGSLGAEHVFTLEQAMEAQPPSNYNDIAVGWLAWERNLPWAVDAFVLIGEANLENAAVLARMRTIHRRFLQWYGLRREEVPLLLMASVCQQPCWLPWDMRCVRPQGTQCFTDISD